MKRVLSLVSGADSVATALYLKETGWDVLPLFVKYGMPAEKAEEFTLRKIFKNGFLSLPLYGVWKNRKRLLKTNQDSFIPHRNTVLLSIAAAIAAEEKIKTISFGLMANDVTHFDNSIQHHKMMSDILSKNLGVKLTIVLPFSKSPKKRVLSFLKKRHIETVSCWNAVLIGRKVFECGECMNCHEKIQHGGTVRSLSRPQYPSLESGL